MNKYFAIASLLAFVAWSGFMYYEGISKETALCEQKDAKHDAAQANVTIAAEKGVIATVVQQQTITQGVDNAYQTKKSFIDNQYASGTAGVLGQSTAPAPASMPAAGNTTCRPDAAPSRPFRTSFFKLTAKECDENTEQLYGLQQWVRQQTAIKQPSAVAQ